MANHKGGSGHAGGLQALAGERQDLRIRGGATCAYAFGSDLGPLPMVLLLRPLIAEGGAGVLDAQRQRLVLQLIEIGPDHRGSELGA